MIAAAAKAGCEYFVIDAGWYADLHEDWSQTIGAWQPSTTRWPHGLKFLLDQIRQAGMVPGLWLEPEVAGAKSVLAQKPDNWFFMRHGKRVLKNSRLLLDFRNPEVRAYLDQVMARLVNDYGVGYIKMDYNVDSLQGTEINADSFGQGLLEHNRAHLAWLERIVKQYPGPGDRKLRQRRRTHGLRDAQPSPDTVDDRPGKLSEASGDPGRRVSRRFAGATRDMVLPAGQCGCRSSQLQHGDSDDVPHSSERAPRFPCSASFGAGCGRDPDLQRSSPQAHSFGSAVLSSRHI